MAPLCRRRWRAFPRLQTKTAILQIHVTSVLTDKVGIVSSFLHVECHETAASYSHEGIWPWPSLLLPLSKYSNYKETLTFAGDTLVVFFFSLSRNFGSFIPYAINHYNHFVCATMKLLVYHFKFRKPSKAIHQFIRNEPKLGKDCRLQCKLGIYLSWSFSNRRKKRKAVIWAPSFQPCNVV